MSAQKYLDLTGLNTYHNEMVKRIVDLEYDPERMFDDKDFGSSRILHCSIVNFQ